MSFASRRAMPSGLCMAYSACGSLPRVECMELNRPLRERSIVKTLTRLRDDGANKGEKAGGCSFLGVLSSSPNMK